jgi:hypothetical protein
MRGQGYILCPILHVMIFKYSVVHDKVGHNILGSGGSVCET